MKVLITGGSGFYGTHLCEEFKSHGYEVISCDIRPNNNVFFLDIMDQHMIQKTLEEYQPDIIVNMAGQANVGLSWEKPQLTVQLNTIGFINILEAVRKMSNRTRVIAIGSSDEYGNMKERGVNVSETDPVKPTTPYAISKLSQELFASLYVENYGLDICMVRQFNLGGPGQMKGFLISDFASGIAEIEFNKTHYLCVGNLDSERDFTHVKDASRALRLIAEKGHTGEIYNICSGRSYKAKDILDRLMGFARTTINIVQDPTRMRPSDTPVLRGNHDKLTAHTGWKPELDLDSILHDSLNYWRERMI